MVVLLGILIVVWLVSSNIKWALIAAAVFMLSCSSCRLRRDGDERPIFHDQPKQSETCEANSRKLSDTGLPIAQRRYMAGPPGELLNAEGW